ncbi:hypothetical protein SERLA73DRAFT_176444 [Serpula lacrymans var. lacrymans S7.3]|uniref:Uncharacterized protein n=2 Tax=Serpula lacrymans var. lacrymans TaxID=341189 RepID=F8PMX4_SERL3|nr:uncharacterized protein SERLADRAFT_459305 [Serpula lacrymans var. lacrymans S7.9]EGO02956.1 hypothetical protein SERLA73DRAFT_176444 [Serpula lacrymans var. lacrymans S7.3]EGO28639.1 hypothetical protein SERLADRAFT_459305 [Serpula lacrymans var. lacrymans S7.9]
MLVEDDFPICGEWGWGGVRGVMNELEKGRHNSTLLDRWGGFVGTGGSGLIVHRSLLSVLIFLMRAHSDLISPLPPALPQRPADLIIQDCLLGNDPLCPRRPGGGSLVITSKLAMDHIGALSSTTKGRRYEEDKWKCGWRHPFHGQPEVVVVPI